jgi:hypothetical protein
VSYRHGEYNIKHKNNFMMAELKLVDSKSFRFSGWQAQQSRASQFATERSKHHHSSFITHNPHSVLKLFTGLAIAALMPGNSQYTRLSSTLLSC